MPEHIVTYKENGKERITVVHSSDPEKTLHTNSVYKQNARWLKQKLGGRSLSEMSEVSLGYILHSMPIHSSNITSIKIRKGEYWNKILQHAMSTTKKKHEAAKT